MLVNIKPHSSLKKYFRGDDLVADLNTYADIVDYIRAMHPDFITYNLKQAENQLQESFTFLDKDLRELTTDELQMRRPRKNDIIYIVPSIIGGGGKRGVFALLAIAAFMFFLPVMFPALGTAGVFGSTTLMWGSVAQTIGLNLALMSISMLLAPKQKTSESSRDNGAFGSLTNSVSSGTPIALHYGLVRVAGQLITGYTKTVEKLPSDTDVTVSSVLS